MVRYYVAERADVVHILYNLYSVSLEKSLMCSDIKPGPAPCSPSHPVTPLLHTRGVRSARFRGQQPNAPSPYIEHLVAPDAKGSGQY